MYLKPLVRYYSRYLKLRPHRPTDDLARHFSLEIETIMQSREQSGGPLGEAAPSATVDDVGAADCDDDCRGRKKRPREDETDVGGDDVVGGPGVGVGVGIGIGIGIGKEDDRERGSVKEKEDEDRDDGPRPFVLLPFHGEHKRAVTSLSFAPSAHLGGPSWNSGGEPGVNASS